MDIVTRKKHHYKMWSEIVDALLTEKLFKKKVDIEKMEAEYFWKNGLWACTANCFLCHTYEGCIGCPLFVNDEDRKHSDGCEYFERAKSGDIKAAKHIRDCWFWYYK